VKNWTPGLLIAFTAVAVLYVFELCQGPPPVVEPAIPAVVRDSIDELKRLVLSRDTARIRAESIAEAVRVFGQGQADRARTSERTTQSKRREADSLRVELVTALTAADTIPILLQVVAKQDTALDTLSAALFSERQSHSADIAIVGIRTAQRDSAYIERDDWRRAADRFEGLLGKADARIVQLSKGCRILGIVRCPSRGEMLAVGMVIGGGIMYAAQRD
jgi:hypothetical protein